jgi:hypothetical protein
MEYDTLHQIWIHISNSMILDALLCQSLPDDGPMRPKRVAGNKYSVVKY